MSTSSVTHTATILYEFASKQGQVAVVKLDPPLAGHEFVVSSAVDLDFGLTSMFPDMSTCETYLFPADPAEVGKKSRKIDHLVSDWGELPGSVKDVKDHRAALAEAGYEVRP